MINAAIIKKSNKSPNLILEHQLSFVTKHELFLVPYQSNVLRDNLFWGSPHNC